MKLAAIMLLTTTAVEPASAGGHSDGGLGAVLGAGILGGAAAQPTVIVAPAPQIIIIQPGQPTAPPPLTAGTLTCSPAPFRGRVRGCRSRQLMRVPPPFLLIARKNSLLVISVAPL